MSTFPFVPCKIIFKSKYNMHTEKGTCLKPAGLGLTPTLLLPSGPILRRLTASTPLSLPANEGDDGASALEMQ